jgi:hypothetical protein
VVTPLISTESVVTLSQDGTQTLNLGGESFEFVGGGEKVARYVKLPISEFINRASPAWPVCKLPKVCRCLAHRPPPAAASGSGIARLVIEAWRLSASAKSLLALT